MEFDQYLEQDILKFLDSKMSKKETSVIDREEDYGLYLTKDYLRELIVALDNDELTKAKKLFDELKGHYSRLPKNSVERKKIYSILEKMYEKIQDYVKIKDGRVEVIKQGNSAIYIDKDEKDKNSKLNEILKETKKHEEILDKPIDKKYSPKNKFGLFNKKENSKDISKDISSKKTSVVENNILQNGIKEVKTSNYYDEKTKKTVEDDIIKQNISILSSDTQSDLENSDSKSNISQRAIFDSRVASKKDVNKDNSLGRANMNTAFKERAHDVYLSSENADISKLKDEIISQILSGIEKMGHTISEKVYEDLSRKIKEDYSTKQDDMEKFKDDIRTYVAKEMTVFSEELMLKENSRMNKFREEMNSRMDLIERKIDFRDELRKFVPKSELELSSQNSIYDSEIPFNDVKIVSQDANSLKSTSSHSFKKINSKKDVALKDKSLDSIYEHAIYEMCQNNFESAARLFKKVLDLNPSNMAAKIRLAECIEKNPQINLDIQENAQSSDLNEFNTANALGVSKISKNESLSNNSQENSDFRNNSIENSSNKEFDVYDFDANLNKKEYDIDYLRKNLSKTLEKLDTLEKVDSPKKDHSKERIQKLYEQAIHVMNNRDYDRASFLLNKILELNPNNAAAKIRLQECMEAKSNA